MDATIRFRRVPGFYNRSTYHVDVDGQHTMTVRRVSDATWTSPATWSAYRPGIDWSKVYLDDEARAERRALSIGYGPSRAEAVKNALRALAAEVPA